MTLSDAEILEELISLFYDTRPEAAEEFDKLLNICSDKTLEALSLYTSNLLPQ